MSNHPSLNSSIMFPTQNAYTDYLTRSLLVLETPKKEGRYIFVTDQSIQEVGQLRYIIELIREVFGFVNRTSLEALEYQVIRSLTCGLQNKWIDDSNIEKINRLAQIIIKKQHDEQHSVLAALIDMIKDVKKGLDFKIDSIEFNAVYFEQHKKQPFGGFLRQLIFKNNKDSELNPAKEKKQLKFLNVKVKAETIVAYQEVTLKTFEKIVTDLEMLRKANQENPIEESYKQEELINKRLYDLNYEMDERMNLERKMLKELEMLNEEEDLDIQELRADIEKQMENINQRWEDQDKRLDALDPNSHSNSSESELVILLLKERRTRKTPTSNS